MRAKGLNRQTWLAPLIAVVVVFVILTINTEIRNALATALFGLSDAIYAQRKILIVLAMAALATSLLLYVYIDYSLHNLPRSKNDLFGIKRPIRHARTVIVPHAKRQWKKISLHLGIGVAVLLSVSLMLAARLSPIYAYASNEFVTTWKTDNPGGSASNQIEIMTSGSGYNYNIDWGDGNVGTNQMSDAIHTYATAGTYTVKITGAFPRIYFSEGGPGTDVKKLLSVEQWGSNQWQTMNGAFFGAENLVVNATDAPDLSAVTDMSLMFVAATNFNSNIDSWDVSNVTDMGGMFAGATSFNQSLASWDVTGAAVMDNMLTGTALSTAKYDATLEAWSAQNLQGGVTLGAENLTYCTASAARSNIITNDGWTINDSGEDCSLDFTDAFVTAWKTDNAGATASNQVAIPINTGLTYNYNVDWGDGNIDSGITAGATHTYASAGTYTVKISGDFPAIYCHNSGNPSDCEGKLLTVEQWGENQWESMVLAFYGAENLTIPAPDVPDLSGVTNMSYMFQGATLFNSDISDWNVSTITNMYGAFYGATSFNQPLNSWNMSNVEGLQAMFLQATSFNQSLDSWDVSEVTDMAIMFAGATSFNQDISSWNTTGVTAMGGMFSGSTAFNQPLNSWDMSTVVNINGMFSGATSFNRPLNNWSIENVETMQNLFYGATAFNQPLNSWDVSGVTAQFGMEGVFRSATSFNQDISSWDVSAVTDMYAMFRDATAFNQPLNSWDVGNVQITFLMFAGATSFNQPLSNWDTSSFQNMTGMFAGATSFDQSLAGWDVSAAIAMDYLFNTNLLGSYAPSGISTLNYDATLLGWSQLNLNPGVTFEAGLSTYCDAADERADIISSFSWTIIDSGENCDDTPGEPEVVDLPEEPEEPGEIGEPEEPPTFEELLPSFVDDPSLVNPPGPSPLKAEPIQQLSQNALLTFVGRLPVPAALGIPWLLLILALILAGSQYYSVYAESKSTERIKRSLQKQRELVDEQDSFVALSTHYIHTPLTIIEGEISLMTRAGTLSAAQATKLKDELASFAAEAEKIVAAVDQKPKELPKL